MRMSSWSKSLNITINRNSKNTGSFWTTRSIIPSNSGLARNCLTRSSGKRRWPGSHCSKRPMNCSINACWWRMRNIRSVCRRGSTKSILPKASSSTSKLSRWTRWKRNSKRTWMRDWKPEKKNKKSWWSVSKMCNLASRTSKYWRLMSSNRHISGTKGLQETLPVPSWPRKLLPLTACSRGHLGIRARPGHSSRQSAQGPNREIRDWCMIWP